MSATALSALLVGLAFVAYLTARARAAAFREPAGRGPVPGHHAAYAALWTLLPPLAFVALWLAVSPALATDAVLGVPAAAQLPPPGFERAAILSEARALAEGDAAGAFHPLARALAPAYAAAGARYAWIGTAAALLLAAAGALRAFVRLRPGFPARPAIERAVTAGLLAASLVAILTTAGILLSLVWESARFFRLVSPADFLLGTHWSPQSIDARDPGASLGAVPLFWGTFLIGAVIAMLVALPLGVLSAIYLTQYAAPRARARIKPLLEVLAGVPSVVYGYFAALVVAPAVRDLALRLGAAGASGESALAAGAVMGIMIVPFVSSLADDALAAVPPAMRDGSLALGATRSETIRRVLLPAALPGVVGGVLLAVSRAIGETMIVVMAASGLATLSANPLDPATTVTRQIVDLLTGEAEFAGPKTLAAFALGLTLFAITFLLNSVALSVVRRHRRAYE